MSKLILSLALLPVAVWAEPLFIRTLTALQAGDANCTISSTTPVGMREGICLPPSRRAGNCEGVHYPQTCSYRNGIMFCEPEYVGLDPKCAKPKKHTKSLRPI